MIKVKENGYSLYLTGDIGHHEGLDAMDMGLSVIDATHYGLEHIFIPYLHDYLKKMLKDETLEIVTADTGTRQRYYKGSVTLLWIRRRYL